MAKPEFDWEKFEGAKIPSSLELNPVVFTHITPNSRILDVGCGFGKTMSELYRKGYKNVSGIDVNASGVQFARSRFEEFGVNIDVRIGDANQLPYANDSFDLVITQAFWTTIVENSKREEVAKELGRVLVRGGLVYIADFGRTWDQYLYRKRYLDGKSKGLETGTFEARNRQTGEFMYLAHHYTGTELSTMLRNAGFEKPLYYEHTKLTTQSGNTINGHIILAKKD